MITLEEIKKYQQKLEEEKQAVLRERKGIEQSEDFGSDIDHGDEEADETEEFGNQLEVVRTLDERRNEIDMALSRIAMGKYGICESCGKEISKEVLDVAPESALCALCKQSAKVQ